MAASPLQGQKDLDDCSRVFRWNYVFMTAMGIWPAKPSEFRYFLNFGYMFYIMVLEYMDLFLYIDDLEHVLINLTENVAFTQIFVRMYEMHASKNNFGELISEISKDFNAKDYTEEEREIFLSYYTKSKIFAKLLITNTVLTATSYYVKPLLGQIDAIIAYAGSTGKNSSFIFILPYRFHTFYEIKDASTYFWTYGTQVPFVFVSALGQIVSDCFMITTAYHLSGQMAVLALRIKNINTNPSRCTAEIQKLIKLHIKLLRIGKIVEETFRTMLLMQQIGANLLICILGYQILTVLFIGEKAILVSLFAFIFLVLLILYTHCTAGESLIIESDRVCHAYYDCKWYEMSIDNAKAILFCIHRSQKSLQLTAGKFTTFCLTTLTDTLKTSLGYLSVLRTVM